MATRSITTTSVFTDGACAKNGSRRATGGIGVFFGDGDPRNVSIPGSETATAKITNQTMELSAIIKALEIISQERLNVPRKVDLYSDSEYCIKSLTVWIINWQRNGWKTAFGKGDVKNKDLLVRAWDLMQALKSQGILLSFMHVRSHQAPPSRDHPSYFTWYGNEQADRLARQAGREHAKATAPPDDTHKLRAFMSQFKTGKVLKLTDFM